MKEIVTTTEFSDWLRKLKDKKGKAIIDRRILRLKSGHFGDTKWFQGIGELRVKFGPGYRVYFVEQGETIIILLCGGDKGTQKRDIKRAVEMAKEL